MSEVLVLGPDALQAKLDSFFTDKIVPLLSSFSPQTKPPEELIDRRGAAKFFDVSLPTLDAWTKGGTITGYRIGGHIRYKRSELMQSLTAIQSVKQTARG